MKNADQTLIEDSEISESFQAILHQHGYVTIEEVLTIPVTEFIQMKWFTAGLLEELHNWQKKRG